MTEVQILAAAGRITAVQGRMPGLMAENDPERRKWVAMFSEIIRESQE